MAVITTDVTLEGWKRDDVLAWLAIPDNHARLLSAAFGTCKEIRSGEWEVTLPGPPRARPLRYRFDRVDDAFGGRRVLVQTTGRRVAGSLHYSLRTLKPSTNTLVTIHLDYKPGDGLGFVVNRLWLQAALEKHLQKMLEEIRSALASPA